MPFGGEREGAATWVVPWPSRPCSITGGTPVARRAFVPVPAVADAPKPLGRRRALARGQAVAAATPTNPLIRPAPAADNDVGECGWRGRGDAAWRSVAGPHMVSTQGRAGSLENPKIPLRTKGRWLRRH